MAIFLGFYRTHGNRKSLEEKRNLRGRFLEISVALFAYGGWSEKIVS